MFDRLRRLLKEPWSRNYCDLSERPAKLARVIAKRQERDEDKKYTFRRITTPHLDAFNGMPGGWC